MAKNRQTHGVPAILSLIIPGLGQIVKGHVIKGILIFIAISISIFVTFASLRIFITPILWLWNIYDAYNSN